MKGRDKKIEGERKFRRKQREEGREGERKRDLYILNCFNTGGSIKLYEGAWAFFQISPCVHRVPNIWAFGTHPIGSSGTLEVEQPFVIQALTGNVDVTGSSKTGYTTTSG